MEIQCPACRRLNNDKDMLQCGRCGCDISPLRTIMESARQQTGAARKALTLNVPQEALRCAAVSWQLKKSTESARVGFIASLLLEDYSSASKWYGRAGGVKGEKVE